MVWFIFIIMVIFLLTWPKIMQKYRIWLWRRRLSIQLHQRIFDGIFSSVNGFIISKQARTTHDALEYIYGEILFEPFVALLSLCRPHKDTVFYDLGCGIGKAVLATAMVFDVKKACGIEVLAPLYQCALQQKNKLAQLPAYQNKIQTIEFKEENLFDTSLTDATLIFIHGSAFFGALWEKISTKMEGIPPGCCVLSTSKPLLSSHFRVLEQHFVTMTWGQIPVFIQERI